MNNYLDVLKPVNNVYLGMDRLLEMYARQRSLIKHENSNVLSVETTFTSHTSVIKICNKDT